MVEYTGLDIHGALALPCDLFMLCYRNWWIERLEGTEEGRKYLSDCRRLNTTKMDRRALDRLVQRLGGE